MSVSVTASFAQRSMSTESRQGSGRRCRRLGQLADGAPVERTSRRSRRVAPRSRPGTPAAPGNSLESRLRLPLRQERGLRGPGYGLRLRRPLLSASAREPVDRCQPATPVRHTSGWVSCRNVPPAGGREREQQRPAECHSASSGPSVSPARRARGATRDRSTRSSESEVPGCLRRDQRRDQRMEPAA